MYLSMIWYFHKLCYIHPQSQAGPIVYLCLRTCLETLLDQTVLRLALVLVNTLAPIRYLIFLKTSMTKRHFIFMKCILILGNYKYNRTQNDLLLDCYTSVKSIFSNFASRHMWYFGDTRPIVSERAKTTPSHRVDWLSSCLRSCCWDSDRKSNSLS